MKNNKGITLIALVVTIIVLLILAGVSIAMLTGENGILNRAKESSVQNAIGAAKDEVALLASEAVTDYYKTVYVNATGNVAYTNTELNNQVKAKVVQANIKTSGITLTWTSDKVKLAYTDGSYVEGNLSQGRISWDPIQLQANGN